jgi:hypothetical protein
MRIELRDGLRGSGGLPSQNAISWQGASFEPPPDAIEIGACTEPSRRLMLVPSSHRIEASLAAENRFEVDVRIAQDAAATHGWSLAVRHDDDAIDLLRVGFDGTAIEDLVTDSGFVLFELTRGSGNDGFVAEAVLSADPRRVLPADTTTLAIAEYRVASIPDHGAEYTTAIAFASSLRGSIGTVANALAPVGPFELGGEASIEIARAPVVVILRGDANADRKVDIGDPIASLFHLFLDEGIVCADAGDANADGAYDVSDVIFTLSYLFLGGRAPSAPFPRCAATERTLGCERVGC